MKRKKDVSGRIFSAFMLTAFVICSYFFINLINDSTGLGETAKLLLRALVCTVFGALLFYATRIGDGRQIKRFSLATLIILDLPALYVILAAAAPGLPFPFDLSKATEVIMLAGVALGYGIPYTFLSGYEIEPDEADEADGPDEAQGPADTEAGEEELSEDGEAEEAEEDNEPGACGTKEVEEDNGSGADGTKEAEEDNESGADDTGEEEKASEE